MARRTDGRRYGPRIGRWLTSSAYRSRRKIATAAAIALAVLIGYHVVNGHNGITIYQQKRAEDRVLQLEITRLQQENLDLKGHVERLQTDPDAIIHEARERLHYTRPGEVIYSLNDGVSQNEAPPDKTAEAKAASTSSGITGKLGDRSDLPHTSLRHGLHPGRAAASGR